MPKASRVSSRTTSTARPNDIELLAMIRHHDDLWRELERRADIDDDPQRDAMAHEAEMLAVTIVAAEANTPRALAGKRRVINREMFDRDEIVRLVLNADIQRIASGKASSTTATATGPHATA